MDGDACPPGISHLGRLVVSLDTGVICSAGLAAGWVTVVPVASPRCPALLTRQRMPSQVLLARRTKLFWMALGNGQENEPHSMTCRDPTQLILSE